MSLPNHRGHREAQRKAYLGRIYRIDGMNQKQLQERNLVDPPVNSCQNYPLCPSVPSVVSSNRRICRNGPNPIDSQNACESGLVSATKSSTEVARFLRNHASAACTSAVPT